LRKEAKDGIKVAENFSTFFSLLFEAYVYCSNVYFNIIWWLSLFYELLFSCYSFCFYALLPSLRGCMLYYSLRLYHPQLLLSAL
jgi:hypothetical protein